MDVYSLAFSRSFADVVFRPLDQFDSLRQLSDVNVMDVSSLVYVYRFRYTSCGFHCLFFFFCGFV